MARDFRRSVDRYLVNRTDSDESSIRYWLTVWQENHNKLRPLMVSSPVLQEVEPLSERLSLVASLGLRALNILEKNSGKGLLPDDSSELLRVAREPEGQVEIMVVSAVAKLVDAASKREGSR